MNIEDIGLDDDALVCTTANTASCSRSESPGGAILGQWFYPNGSAVSDCIVDAQGDMWEFYRTRVPSIVFVAKYSASWMKVTHSCKYAENLSASRDEEMQTIDKDGFNIT